MKRIWDADELAAAWSLKHDELNLLKTKPVRNYLGFVAQLKHYQLTGRSLNNRPDISDPPLQYLADQLDMQVSDIQSYDFTGRSGSRHRKEILNSLGIQRVTAHDKRVFTEWLIEEVYPRGINVEEAAEQAFDWFSKNKIESLTSAELNRLTRAAFNRYEMDLFITISDTLPPFSKEKMSLCLEITDRSADFNNLKADPGRIGLESVLVEIEKLHFIRSLDLPFKLFQTINGKASKEYYQRICSESAWEVKQHPPEIRYSLLGIFFYFRQREIIDGLIELFILTVHRLTVQAERKLTKELLSDFQKVHGKTTLLFRIAEATLLNPEGRVKDVIYPVAGENILQNLLKEFKSSGPGYKQRVYKIIRSSYSSHYRRMVPKTLESLTFCSGNVKHRPVLEALEWIEKNRDNSNRYIQLDDGIPIDGVIRNKGRNVVIEEDGKGKERINRINYEICTLQALRDQRRCKEIWVEGADKFRNPDDDLPVDFNDKREDYYLDLGHSIDSSKFIAGIRAKMQSALSYLNQGMPDNPKVRLLNRNKKNISITPFEPQEEPLNLISLKREITGRWPMTGLLDVLKEADLRIGFTDHFKTLVDREILDRQILQRRLLLCLYGKGTNTGLKRASGNRHGISYKELPIRKPYYVALPGTIFNIRLTGHSRNLV